MTGEAEPVDASEDRLPKIEGGAGQGRVVPMVVIATIGVLVMALLATMAIGVERWWSGRAVPSSASTVANGEPTLGNPADWITSEDYPASSIRAEEEGAVRIEARFGADGWPVACRVVSPSGHGALDAAACGAVMRRGRLGPVVTGTPDRVISRRVVWRLPR